jgi:hypothetical protein
MRPTNHLELEPEDEADADDEPSLGSFDRMTGESKSCRLRLWDTPGIDAERDDGDRKEVDPNEAKQHRGDAVMAKEHPWHQRHAIMQATALRGLKATTHLVMLPGFLGWRTCTEP